MTETEKERTCLEYTTKEGGKLQEGAERQASTKNIDNTYKSKYNIRMDTKLTLKLNQESILLAKNYVAEKGISLSKLVENFFDSISLESAEMSATSQYSALVQELSGIISLPADFDEKLEYESYLRKKYE